MADRNFPFHFEGDIYPSRSGIEDPNQPDAMYVFLFIGST